MYGSGTTFSRSADGLEPFVVLAEVAEITPGEETRASVERPLLADTNSVVTTMPGAVTPGECQVKLYWKPDDTGQIALKADFNTQANFHYRITYPDGTTETFPGHITKWGKAQVTKSNEIMREISIKKADLPVEVTA